MRGAVTDLLLMREAPWTTWRVAGAKLPSFWLVVVRAAKAILVETATTLGATRANLPRLPVEPPLGPIVDQAQSCALLSQCY